MHRSSGAYEALRSSGCLWLQSQWTFRDCTHYVQASTGFSTEVDRMLMQAAAVDICPEREKCTILLLDEMHICKDLVFDKHTGAMIGFANLGDINVTWCNLRKVWRKTSQLLLSSQRLWWFSWSVACSAACSSPMRNFHVLSWLASCCTIPFGKQWEEWRTVDSRYVLWYFSTNVHITCPIICTGPWTVNRRLIKLHQPSADLIYRVRNPYAQEERLCSSFPIHPIWWRPFEIAGSPSSGAYGYFCLHAPHVNFQFLNMLVVLVYPSIV